MSGLTKVNRSYNIEHPPPDNKLTSLLSVSETDMDKSICNVRIPYEDMDEKRCTTVDALLLLASGMKAGEAAQIISKRYDIDYNERTVWDAKSRHPDDFVRMQVFYREIFLNQQLQGAEQMCLQRLSSCVIDMEVDSVSDALKLTQMMKNISDIRKTKEEQGDGGGIGKDKIKELEGSMKALLAKKVIDE